MNQWMKYLAVIVGVPALVFALALTAFSITTEQTGISGKQVYSYDTITGFARMQVVIKDILVLAGGEHVGDTEDEGYQRVVGGPTRAYALLTDVIIDGSGATVVLPVGGKTFFSKIVGSAGAQSATITVWGDYKSTATEEFLVCTMSLTGTSEDAKKCTGITEDYKYYHAKVASISGTDATINVWAEMGLGGGSAGSGGEVTNGGTFVVQENGAALTALQLIDNVVVAEDTAHANAEGLAKIGCRRQDNAGPSSATDGDWITVDCTNTGALRVSDIDPCSAIAKTHIVINISTATTTELTPSLAGASTNYYVCSIDIVTAAANNVALVDDNTDGCGSVTAGLAGGITAATGWNLAANGGIVKGNGSATVFKSVTSNSVLCLMTSAATQLSGSIQVVAAP